MSNTSIQLKKSGITGNTPVNLQHGEVAINYADGKLYYKDGLDDINYITNQDTFATINVNGSLIVATSPSDILNLLPGTNTTITACTTTKTITISSSGGGGGASGSSDKTYTFYQNTAPATSNAHDLWVNSETGFVYENFGTPSTPIWAEFGPTGVMSNTEPGQIVVSSMNVYNQITFSDETTLYSTNNITASFIQANAAFIKANTPDAIANSSALYANGAFVQANAAYNQANNSLTLTGGSLTGRLNVSFTPATTVNAAIQISAANTQGGTGYADFLRVINSSAGTTNPNKTFRLNSTGGIEIINSAYSGQVMSVSDAGVMSVGSAYQIAGKKAVNGPAFSAYANATLQTITNGSQQKVLFQTEEFDTDGCFASSRFTPTVEGYYQLNAEVRLDGASGTGEMMIIIYKNGSEYKRGTNQQGTQIAANFWAMQVSSMVYANGTTDYFEIYVQQGSGGSVTVTAVNNPAITWFNGCMLRGA